MSESLDLRPWARKTFHVTGATGREYVVEEWLPMAAVVEIASLVEELQQTTAETLRGDPQRYEGILKSGHELALGILGRSIPGLTADELEADMPDEAVFRFLGFLYRRWRARQEELRMAPGSLDRPETATEATPRPSTTSTPPVARKARTGSKSAPTSLNGHRAR